MTPEYKAKVGDLESLLFHVLRICGVHFDRYVVSRLNCTADKLYFSGIADLKHLSKETRSRMQQLRHLRSPAELAEFEAWLGDIDDPTGHVECDYFSYISVI